jgi:hypothetical protein
MKTSRVRGLAAVLLACLAVTDATSFAKERTPKVIAKGAQVGVVNLLKAEVMHYHAARDSAESFLKILPVGWPVDDMLAGAVKGPLEQLGLTAMPMAPTDALEHVRESCFVNAKLAEGLPKNCAAPLIDQAGSSGVNYLILLAPGLNDANHAGSYRVEDVTSAMRGWGFLTSQRAGAKDKPPLFNEVELLLIAVSPEGATLYARQWGGLYKSQWETYTMPADLKQFPAEQLDQLQPLFAGLLSRQVKGLLEQVHVEP